MVVPVYNAELSPPSLRGRLVSLAQLFITLGIMVNTTNIDTCKQMMFFRLKVSFVASLACAEYIEGWRIALGLQCVLAIVLIIGMLFLPETPRYGAYTSLLLHKSSSTISLPGGWLKKGNLIEHSRCSVKFDKVQMRKQ